MCGVVVLVGSVVVVMGVWLVLVQVVMMERYWFGISGVVLVGVI